MDTTTATATPNSNPRPGDVAIVAEAFAYIDLEAPYTFRFTKHGDGVTTLVHAVAENCPTIPLGRIVHDERSWVIAAPAEIASDRQFASRQEAASAMLCLMRDAWRKAARDGDPRIDIEEAARYREEVAARRFNRLVEAFQDMAGRWPNEAAKLAARLDRVIRSLDRSYGRPASQLAWSLDVFQAAADFEVAQHALEILRLTNRDGATLDERVAQLLKHATDRVLQGARCPARSTSPTSNLAEECMTASWAKIVEAIGYYKMS